MSCDQLLANECATTLACCRSHSCPSHCCTKVKRILMNKCYSVAHTKIDRPLRKKESNKPTDCTNQKYHQNITGSNTVVVVILWKLPSTSYKNKDLWPNQKPSITLQHATWPLYIHISMSFQAGTVCRQVKISHIFKRVKKCAGYILQ